jgi:hypothetical protein
MRRPDRDALLASIHSLVEAAGVVREGWNGYNVIHDNASRVAALDIGFAPRCVASRRAALCCSRTHAEQRVAACVCATGLQAHSPPAADTTRCPGPLPAAQHKHASRQPRSSAARKHSGAAKVVYLLGADDYADADVPADAFVIYQVRVGVRGAPAVRGVNRDRL